MSAAAALFRREAALAFGRGGAAAYGLAFYAALTALFPLAAGPEPGRLASVAPGLAFAALALASLLTLERLFERDFEDGALDLLACGPLPLEAICAAKCVAQWISGGLLLSLAAPAAAVALGAPPDLAPWIFGSALLSGVGFAFTGGVGAALSLGSRRGGLLIAVIVLPLYAPPVIFGAGAVHEAATGLPAGAAFGFLTAYALAAAALGPFAMAAACRNALD